MDILSYLVGAAVVVWVVGNQFAGRFVPASRSLVLPLVLLIVGFSQATHVTWTTLAVVVVAADLVLTAVLGVVRGYAIRLSLREGCLYQRGGWLSVGLWVATIAARLAVALPFAHTSAGPALAATLTATFGVSLAAQYLVFNARVAADGRPVRPVADRRGDRRGERARSTLGR
jgi:hypothetical protein